MMSLVINVSDIKQSTYLKQPTNRERVMERGGEREMKWKNLVSMINIDILRRLIKLKIIKILLQTHIHQHIMYLLLNNSYSGFFLWRKIYALLDLRITSIINKTEMIAIRVSSCVKLVS